MPQKKKSGAFFPHLFKISCVSYQKILLDSARFLVELSFNGSQSPADSHGSK